jgi:hypothetical protein
MQSATVCAENELQSYADLFSGNLQQEDVTINNFLSTFEKVKFQNEESVSGFRASLRSYQKTLDSFLAFYRRPLPAGAPDDLREAVRLAIDGTEKILDGMKGIDRSISNLDKDLFESGRNSFNEGINMLRSAVAKYNSFVTTHTDRRQYDSSISGDDIGLTSALGITYKYGKPLLYLYIYLLIAGFFLSSRFRSKLGKLISGKLEAEKFKGTVLYGFHLIVLFPYLYALLAFSILLVWDFALVAVLVVSKIGYISMALIIALFVVTVQRHRD